MPSAINQDTGLIAFNLEKAGPPQVSIHVYPSYRCNRQQQIVLDSHFWNSIDAKTTFCLRKVEINLRVGRKNNEIRKWKQDSSFSVLAFRSKLPENVNKRKE